MNAREEVIPMKRVRDKYRGQTVYFHVMAELIRAAQYCGSATYQDIAVIMGLPVSGSYMGRETGYILGEITGKGGDWV